MRGVKIPEEMRGLHSPLDAKMGLELMEVSAERAVARMPVEGNTQPFGFWHGGATCVMAETLGSFAANVHGHSRGMVAVGVDINATHHRSTNSGWITGTATALALGSRVAAYQVELVDDAGTRIATARITCNLIERQGRPE